MRGTTPLICIGLQHRHEDLSPSRLKKKFELRPAVFPFIPIKGTISPLLSGFRSDGNYL